MPKDLALLLSSKALD